MFFGFIVIVFSLSHYFVFEVFLFNIRIWCDSSEKCMRWLVSLWKCGEFFIGIMVQTFVLNMLIFSFQLTTLKNWRCLRVCICVKKGAFGTAYTYAQRQLANFNKIVIVWEFSANVCYSIRRKWQQHTYPQWQRLLSVNMFNFINGWQHNKKQHLMILFVHLLVRSFVHSLSLINSPTHLFIGSSG